VLHLHLGAAPPDPGFHRGARGPYLLRLAHRLPGPVGEQHGHGVLARRLPVEGTVTVDDQLALLIDGELHLVGARARSLDGRPQPLRVPPQVSDAALLEVGDPPADDG
jgi:hypothetical protein